MLGIVGDHSWVTIFGKVIMGDQPKADRCTPRDAG